jgi:TatD DNase family protein
MIDSHVHLNHPDFEKDLEEVVERAQQVGVTNLVNIGFDLGSSQETAALAERLPFVYGAVGVHPHDAKTYNDEVERELERLLEKNRVIAVGEIGLDFYRDLTPRDKQREVFARQLALAGRQDKPVIIHCRDAFEDVIEVLKDRGAGLRGIFHAFTGDESMAKDVLELGFYVGIGGVVTFRKSNLAEVVAGLPRDRFVLETDCPYLTPAPFRGKRNEPAYLVHILEKVAEATGRPVEEIVEQTDRNFAVVMGLEQ